MGTPMKIVEALINKTGSITYETYCNICEAAAPDVDADYAADTVNKIYASLKQRLNDSYKAFRNSPAIQDKIDAKTLKASRKDVQDLVNQFIKDLNNFMSEYKKLHTALTEAAADSTNAEIHRIVKDAAVQEKLIKRSSASTEEKEKALKAVASAKASAVHVALQGVDAAYKQFTDAVSKKDPALEQEARLLKTQCNLFLKQYDMLTEYIISNIAAYAACGLSICIGTGVALMTGLPPLMSVVSGPATAATTVSMVTKGYAPGSKVRKMNAIDKAINKHGVKRLEKQLSKQDADLKVERINNQIETLKKAAAYYKKNGVSPEK